MVASNGKDGALRERKARAEQGLALIGTVAARELAVELDDRIVTLNEAEAASARADTVARVQQEALAAEADLETVIAVIPFMVRTFDPAHVAALPKPESFVDTSVDYHWGRLLPALQGGGKFSQVMAGALEAALTQRDKARKKVETAGAHDARARDREALARKELTAALHKAEVFIHANTAPDDPARKVIKRKLKPDLRSFEEKAAAIQAQADRKLARAKASAARKAKLAAREAKKRSVAASTPVASAAPVKPAEAANDTPTPEPKVVAG